MRRCPLPYDDARRIAGVIWWLDRVRSHAVITDPYSTTAIVSTGDGTGRLVLKVDGRPVIDHTKSIWSDHLSERWVESYDPESFLNFADYLIADVLLKRLGPTWSQFEQKEQLDIETRQTAAPVYTDEERKRLGDLSERFLAEFSPGQEKLSFSIVAEAAHFAGNFGVASAAPRLREIKAALPPPGPPKRSSDKVYAELQKIPYSYDVRASKKAEENEKRRATLESEYDAVAHEPINNDPDVLRRTIDGSLRKIDVPTNPDGLYALATSHKDEQQWALQRLAQIDRKRYADALEFWMQKAGGKWARQFFNELTRIDPARAATIARELPADKIDALTLPAFVVLREAGVVPDEPLRLATIIKMLHDPKTDWLERAHAIEALVPLDDALRYPGREIDEALLKLFARDQADESGTFTLERACLALARRGRTETFDRIAEQLQTTQDKGNYDRVLDALAHLAQRDPARFNSRLVEIIRPHLSHTNKSVPGLIWTIWAADLRDLEPELQRLATNDPEVFEDYKAHASGGEASAVTGRFHLARKILSLWEERDTYTRARLLIALAVEANNEFIEKEHLERFARFKAEMDRLGSELSAEEKQKLSAFLDAMESSPTGSEALRDQDGIARKVTHLAREKL